MTQPPQYPTQPPQNPGYPYPGSPGYPQNQQPSGPYQAAGAVPGYPQNQPSGYPAGPAPAPKRNTTTGIIIAMGVVIVVLVIAVVYLFYHKNDAPAPAQGRGWVRSGDQLTGATMTAKLPPGWRIGEDNGVENDSEIVNDNKGRIKYWSDIQLTPDQSCKNMINNKKKTPSDPVKEIPGKTWSRKPVITYQLTTEQSSQPVIFTFSCLDTGKGTSALFQTLAWAERNEQAINDTQILLTTWKWR